MTRIERLKRDVAIVLALSVLGTALGLSVLYFVPKADFRGRLQSTG